MQAKRVFCSEYYFNNFNVVLERELGLYNLSRWYVWDGIGFITIWTDIMNKVYFTGPNDMLEYYLSLELPLTMFTCVLDVYPHLDPPASVAKVRILREYSMVGNALQRTFVP